MILYTNILLFIQETNTTVAENCQKLDNSHSVSDEDKQIRVSVYWYLRSLKKHKGKKNTVVFNTIYILIKY